MVDKITPVNTFSNIIIGNFKSISDNIISVFGNDINTDNCLTGFWQTPQVPQNNKNDRSKYIKIKENGTYTVKSGDNPDKIAKLYNIEVSSILKANGLDEKSAKNIQIGQVLKIPPTKIVQNVNNLNDVASATGLTLGYIKGLKKIEDNHKLSENKFHNDIYVDANGVKTIGIGHRYIKGEKTHLSNSEVCALLVEDILKIEENIRNAFDKTEIYDSLPAAIKEAIIDIAFNKGVKAVTENKDLMYRLKNGKYEAAINTMTLTESVEGENQMSGLCKRRLFNISRAVQYYKGLIPQSNINTIQKLYNDGVWLLRKECKEKNKSFENQIVGFNREITEYFGDKVKLKLITE